MTRKTCVKCGKRRLLKFFYTNKARSDGYQNTCIDCKRQYNKEWYKKTKDAHRIKVYRLKKARRIKNAKWIVEYLKDHPCIDCGEDNPIVLDFDHVRGTKRSDVAQLASQGYGLTKVKREIAKCEVRCANCHRIKTAESRKSLRWKIVTGS